MNSSHATERYKVDQLYSAKHFSKAALLTCILHLIFTLLVTFLARLPFRVHTTELLSLNPIGETAPVRHIRED